MHKNIVNSLLRWVFIEWKYRWAEPMKPSETKTAVVELVTILGELSGYTDQN